MVSTDASVNIRTFKDVVMSVEGVYMILPLISGNFYVSVEYSKQTELKEFARLVQSIKGVEKIEVYDVLPEDAKIELPEVLEFTENELDVLSKLAVNPRMLDHEIATELGWSAKKVKQVLLDLEEEQKVIWSIRWNPNLGRGVAFTLVIKYNSEEVSAQEITNYLREMYPDSYFNSRVVETKSTIFAVFSVEKVVDMEPISKGVLDSNGIVSCYAITYYNAIVGKTLSRIRLERILEKEGLWPPQLK
jgi:DNA-binding Lrp family transcriptional regulator